MDGGDDLGDGHVVGRSCPFTYSAPSPLPGRDHRSQSASDGPQRSATPLAGDNSAGIAPFGDSSPLLPRRVAGLVGDIPPGMLVCAPEGDPT
jgi:hypothetical protein